ncbi:hypothetical protein ACFYY9_26205 [Streptomyces nigra]|uniref:hypothetical protein n=1 Tax=Streptomyces nigra TaxID=1827580 RepID=UPI0036865EA6
MSDRLTPEREAEIPDPGDPITAGRQLSLLELMDDRAASVVSPVLAAVLDEAERLRARVTELEDQRDRYRAQLVALRNDALNMRGALAPNGQERKVPFPLGETLAPAVEWLIAQVAELAAVRAERDLAQRKVASLKAEQDRDDAEYAEVIAERDRALKTIAAMEGEHYAAVHHDYRHGRDLPYSQTALKEDS